MILSPQLRALAEYMAGEFDNQAQALADPVWYVHLRLWQRPVPVFLFPEPSLVLFAEQANIVNLNQPYRPRFIQLRQSCNSESSLEAQYYMPQNIAAVQGAGQDPERLRHLTPEDLQLLPGCTLKITSQSLSPNHYRFQATLKENQICCFSYRKIGFKTPSLRQAQGKLFSDSGGRLYIGGLSIDI
ncbi:Phycocyanobilin lyase CpcT homolog (fragment) [Planktothrix serta PCC 8927]|uniref:Phycocyanobilin lyase CpcT homolog n=1 Tax=Planktothrix serta PCC 8927 TaxID=671068 RepID=A0A7Z9BPC2_9CYAN